MKGTEVVVNEISVALLVTEKDFSVSESVFSNQSVRGAVNLGFVC